jgi:hypothetical protein
LVDDQNFVPLGALGFVTCDGVGKVEWDLVGATGEVRSELFDVESVEVDRDEFIVDLIEVIAEDVEFFCCCVTSAFTHGYLEAVEQVEAAGVGKADETLAGLRWSSVVEEFAKAGVVGDAGLVGADNDLVKDREVVRNKSSTD